MNMLALLTSCNKYILLHIPCGNTFELLYTKSNICDILHVSDVNNLHNLAGG
jgi:hypothetical protein